MMAKTVYDGNGFLETYRSPVLGVIRGQMATTDNATKTTAFPKSLVLGVVFVVLIFAIGLFIYDYCQGGIDTAIYLRG